MGLRINQNIAAQNAYRNLSVTDNQMSKSLEKLSSGFRINRAADDAAGLSISEGLRAQVGGLKVAVRNAQDAISVVQTAEGALNEVTSMLQRMRDLSVQANNASLDNEAKSAAQAEFVQLRDEINRVAETTAFGKSKLLDGTFGLTREMRSAAPIDAASLTNPVTMTISQIAGADIVGPDGTTAAPINISVDPTDLSAQQIADEVNKQLATALKGSKNGTTGESFGGNELVLSASTSIDNTDPANPITNYSFRLGGSVDFNVTASALTATGDTTGQAANVVDGATPGAFQIGANQGEKLTVTIKEISSETLGLNNLNLTSGASGSTDTGAALAMKALDSAIQSVSDQRASLGAHQNRFEHTINNLNTAVENLSASESRIRDTDMAQEMVSFTRNQILTQAGTAMLSQANQASQNVLSLLR
ncbi:flagellin [Actinoplanes sp. NPDC051861]|uniref:flagellin N-terminal helical domain-containing protein n=1 Tax=Actinoplanes sp. NPDC051861 TaxID=3155170 RepID=UPI003418E2D1